MRAVQENLRTVKAQERRGPRASKAPADKNPPHYCARSEDYVTKVAVDLRQETFIRVQRGDEYAGLR